MSAALADNDPLAIPALLRRVPGSPEERARRRAQAAREARAADAEAGPGPAGPARPPRPRPGRPQARVRSTRATAGATRSRSARNMEVNMPREHAEHPAPDAAAPETELTPRERSTLDAIERVLEQLALVKTEIAAMKIPLDRLERSMTAPKTGAETASAAPGPAAPAPNFGDIAYDAATEAYGVMLRLDTVVATLQQTVEFMGDRYGDLADVLAGQRDTVAEQRDVLKQLHDALWVGLRAGPEAPGSGAPGPGASQETDHG